MTRLIDADLLTTKISFASFPHVDRNGRIDKSWVYELINSCPTVEERPRGKWELHRKDLRVWFECSNCGAYNGGFETEYCPNCGAEMEADNEIDN